MNSARKRWLCGAAYSGMFVFGIVMALLGAILPALSGRLQFQVADIGRLFLAMNFAMLTTSLAMGLAMDRFGMKPPLAAGPLLVAAALVIIMRADAFAQLIPAAFLLGLGGGALNGATNTLIADLYDEPNRKSAALNLLGVFYGFGALFIPFGIGAMLDRFGVDPLLMFAQGLCAAIGVFAATLRFPPPKQVNRLPVSDVPRLLRSPLVLVMAALLFCQSGVEFTLGGYISTYLSRVMLVTVSAASWILAGYWAALMLARVVLSRVLLGVDPHRVLIASAVGACVCAAAIGLSPGAGVASVAVALTGFSMSGIFPTVLGIAGSNFKDRSGTVFGILLTMSLSGGMLLPWISGQIAGAAGLRWVFGLVAIAFAIIAGLSVVMLRGCRTSLSSGAE